MGKCEEQHRLLVSSISWGQHWILHGDQWARRQLKAHFTKHLWKSQWCLYRLPEAWVWLSAGQHRHGAGGSGRNPWHGKQDQRGGCRELDILHILSEEVSVEGKKLVGTSLRERSDWDRFWARFVSEPLEMGPRSVWINSHLEFERGRMMEER